VKEKEATPSRRFDLEALRGQLDTRFFGKDSRFVYKPVVDSTNILAMQLARQGAEEGTVVHNDSQTAGKGRLGRQWLDVQGNHVLSSTVLRPQFSPYLLVMIASLAVVNTISSTCKVAASSTSIKWPNDILIGNRKVAGILIETSHDQKGRMLAIVGIGVNVNGQSDQLARDIPGQGTDQERPGATATTLQSECDHVVNRETFLAHLLHNLEEMYLGLQQEAQEPVAKVNQASSRLIREQWRSQLSTLGRHIEVRQGQTTVSGVAEDVDETGELLLRCHSGKRVSITWGDIGYPTE
jgi:BirA family biotin operon repressor/biotin-[acetyl-CoA-carboxylase] ligase